MGIPTQAIYSGWLKEAFIMYLSTFLIFEYWKVNQLRAKPQILNDGISNTQRLDHFGNKLFFSAPDSKRLAG